MQVNDDKSLAELGFVPSAVGGSAGWSKLLRAKFVLCELAAIVAEEDATPHTHLCRNCYDCRLTESGESKVTNAVWKDMIRQKTSRGAAWAVFGSDGLIHQKNVGAIHDQKGVGKAFAGRSSKSGAAGNRHLLAK